MPAIVTKDGKILVRDGRIVVADVAPGAAPPEGCCCGGCDVESCCVAYDDCPATITITVCPWDYVGGGCVSFVITHQGGGIYRSAGDIDYPAIGGKTGKVLRFETQNWGGLVDQFAIRDSDGMTTWITYSSSCGDGKRLIYNGWQGSSASRARWDSGMTCCKPSCCAPYDLENLPQTMTLTVIVRDGYCDWSGDAPVWVGEGFRTLSIPLTYGNDGDADGASWYYQGNYPCDAQAVLSVYRGGWTIFVYSCPSGDNCMWGQWDSGELVSDLYLAQETSEVCMPPPGVALDDCATFMDSYPMCELPNFDDAHGWRVDY